jgi:Chaperone of endosialidase
MAYDWRSKIAAFCLDKLVDFFHAPVGFFADFRNNNYKTNPLEKKKESFLMKTKIRNSISGLLLIPPVLACFALLPRVQAAPDPAPPPGANTADGAGALAHVTTGNFNTAFGTNALNSLTTGNNNTAQGNSALFSLTTASSNVAIGNLALRFNTSGFQNTAVGSHALNANITGAQNAALGFHALKNNNATDNVGIGWEALAKNTTGTGNTATGSQALFSNETGSFNTAVGFQALTGSNEAFSNTGIGNQALLNCTGADNIALGSLAGGNITGGSANIDIGNAGNVGDSGTIRIGGGSHTATFIAGISGQTASGGVAVFVNANGKLGTSTSSRRFKDEIKPMDKASEAILALKPVTFHYKKEIDPDGVPQFGLVAEDVEKVNPDLVGRDVKGEVYTVRYDAVNAMLLNEFLKEHRTVQEQNRKIQEQDATITQLKKEMEAVVARLKEQDSEIRKVSARIEVSKPAPQVAVNNQ